MRTLHVRVSLSSTHSLFGRDLIADLKSELGGHFEDVVLALMQSTADWNARCLRHAMEGVGTHEKTLIEIICTSSNAAVHAMAESYTRLFKRNLEADVRSETSGATRAPLDPLPLHRQSACAFGAAASCNFQTPRSRSLLCS